MDNAETENENSVKEYAETDTKMSMTQILNTLKKIKASGNMSSQQIKQMQLDVGITQAFFTKKRLPKSKVKHKRKLQKLARRVQRGK